MYKCNYLYWYSIYLLRKTNFFSLLYFSKILFKYLVLLYFVLYFTLKCPDLTHAVVFTL